MAANRSPLKLDKPRRSIQENDKKNVEIPTSPLTPEEKMRLADEKFREMRLKNEKWAQRFDEIENDKKEAGFGGRRAQSAKKSGEAPPTRVLNQAPPKKHLEMNMTGSERVSYEKWTQERQKIDEDRMRRQQRDGQWRREWDRDKQEFYQLNDDETPPPRRHSNQSSSSFGQRNAHPRFPTTVDDDQGGGAKFKAQLGFGGDGEKNFRGGGFIRRENAQQPRLQNRGRREQELESWDDEADQRKSSSLTTTISATTTPPTAAKNFQRYSEKREQKSAAIAADGGDQNGDQKSIIDDKKSIIDQSRDQKIAADADQVAIWDREIAEYELKFAAAAVAVAGDDGQWEPNVDDDDQSPSPPINMARVPSSLTDVAADADQSPTSATTTTTTNSSSNAESGQFDDAATVAADAATVAADAATVAADAATVAAASLDVSDEAEISRGCDDDDDETLNEIEQKMIQKMDENIKAAEAVLDDSGDEEVVEKFVEEILRQF